MKLTALETPRVLWVVEFKQLEIPVSFVKSFED